MSLLADIATFARTASAATMIPADRAILRRHTADTVIARLVGANTSHGRHIADCFPGASATEKIAVHATQARLTETDDIHTASGVTPSSVVVPAALGAFAERPCAPRDLESAIWVGVELLVRLGDALGGAAVLYKGVWQTRAGATLAAAATAARVLGLSQGEMEDALSLALLTSNGGAGRFAREPSGRWIVFASAVENGLRAVQAARRGYCGSALDLEGGWLSKAFGVDVDPARLSNGLGASSVFGALSMKPYCTSRQALPAAEAMRALIAEGLSPSSIAKVVIRVPTPYAAMVSSPLDPLNRSTTYTGAGALVAIAALNPDGLYDVERDTVIHNHDILEFSRRCVVEADPALDAAYPAIWSAAIEATTASGVLRKTMEHPLGSPGNPLDDAGLAQKATKILSFVGRAELAEKTIGLANEAFDSNAAAAMLAELFASA